MFNTSNKTIDDLVKQIFSSFPQGLKHVRADIESNVRAGLASGLRKLDLVTREEFEAQQAVLEHTRERLHALEKTLAELEAQMK